MVVETVGQQDPRAQPGVAAPEPAQFLTAEAKELEPFRGGRILCHHFRIAIRAFNGWDDLVKVQFDGRLRFWVEVHLERLVEWTARLFIPMLALALVWRQPDGLARGQMKLLVHVEDCLNKIITGVEVSQGATRVSKSLCVEDDGFARRQVLDVDAEALRGLVGVVELHARLRLVRLRKDENQVSVQRLAGRDANLDALSMADRHGHKDKCNHQHTKISHVPLAHTETAQV
jgi:hypothetical protein